MTTRQAEILNEVFDRVHNRGQSVQAAYDAVFGEDAFEKLAGEVWEALRG